MPEITKALFAVFAALVALFIALSGIWCTLASQLEEQRKTNALSERMAKVMENE